MNINYIMERQQRHHKLWSETAAVTTHKDVLFQLETMKYQPAYDDFVKEYLPFYSPGIWSDLPNEKQKQLLSFGWFMYNIKTIIIEQAALTEYCKIVLSGNSAFAFTQKFIHRIAQVQVDETYHTLMSYKGIDLCERLSDFNLTVFPDIDLAVYINALGSLPPEEKELAWLALSTVCEATISKYLSVLPGVMTVQPAFRFIAEMHRQDEASHSSLFMDLMFVACGELKQELRQKLATFLKQSIKALTSPDRETWRHLYHLSDLSLPDAMNPGYEKLYNFRILKKYTEGLNAAS